MSAGLHPPRQFGSLPRARTTRRTSARPTWLNSSAAPMRHGGVGHRRQPLLCRRLRVVAGVPLRLLPHLRQPRAAAVARRRLRKLPQQLHLVASVVPSRIPCSCRSAGMRWRRHGLCGRRSERLRSSALRLREQSARARRARLAPCSGRFGGQWHNPSGARRTLPRSSPEPPLTGVSLPSRHPLAVKGRRYP